MLDAALNAVACGRAPDARLLVAPGAEAAVTALGWTDAGDAWRDPRGVATRTTPARNTFRMTLPGGGEVYRKVHARTRGLVRRRRSPARTEWDNLLALRAAGFRVPEPVCTGDCRQGSVLVTRAVDQALPLDAWLAGQAGLPARARARLAATLVATLAPLVARLHAAGFFHRDLYLCHLLVRAAGEEPTLIDLQRVGRGAAPRRRWFVKDLAALLHSTPAWVGSGRRLRFLKLYLAARGLLDARSGSGPWKRWARAVVRKARRIARHVPRYG